MSYQVTHLSASATGLPGKQFARGFTLLEIMVVVLMLTVLAGMVVPVLGNNAARLAADDGERLVLLINRARQEAVMSSRIWRLSFDPEEDTYSFQSSSGSGFEPVARSPFLGTHRARSSFERMEINGERIDEAGSVYLYPSGEQDDLLLYLASGESGRIVRLEPIGSARLQKVTGR